jgi:hypothetical protein
MGDKVDKKQIVINLNDDRDAYVVEDSKNIIHVDEYERIKQLLKESLIDAKRYAGVKSASDCSSGDRGPCRDKRSHCDDERTKVRRHDTIMLAGVRGSGKTTFMLSILNHIKYGRMGIDLDGKIHSECEIETLPIFDPTLIEDKTHIFANIISMIKNRVDQKAKKANCFNDEESDLFRKFNNWEKSFQRLAEGLPTIDGLGGDGFNSDAWLDPQFVMNKGISMAHAANTLEDSFHEFVRQSLCFLDKMAFILCFDDIDTNFGKGWPVLEVLHRYLTTPQLITVLSGDPSLYSTLIRDSQWKNFSDKQLRLECRTRDERQGFKETVAHLEEQYSLKLLKPQRRVFLNNLYQLEQRYDSDTIKITYDNDKHETLSDIYSELFKELGIGRSDMYDSYRFLASMPLRSQKQLLYAFMQQKKPTPATRKFLQDILDIFWSDLTAKHVDVSSLRNNPQNIAIHTLNYLVQNNLLNEGYTLNSNFSEPLTNGAQFALGSVLQDQVAQNPSQIFEYWLRVCMARELGVLMGDRVVSRGEGPSIRNFIDHCALAQSKSPRYLARFSTAYLRAFCAFNYSTKNMIPRRFDEKTWHGTIPLYGLAEKAKGATTEKEDRIDYVLYHPDAKTPPLTRIIGSIPLSGATDHSKRALPIYSIYNILGILGQLIGTARSCSQLDIANAQVAALLYRDAQFREYPLPNWASSYSVEIVEEGSELPSNTDQYDPMVLRFAEQLVLWANLPEEHAISAAQLGNVFTRLFYTLNNLDTQYHNTFLGNWLHRMVVIFIHSVVIVEAMEDHDIANSQLQLTNPVSSDKILIDNLSKLNRDQNEGEITLPFARWILACPLWDLYLQKDSEKQPLKEEIYKFVRPYITACFKREIFVNAKKTESDYVYIFSDYNLASLLNERGVIVKGYELKSEVDENGGNKKFTFSKTNITRLTEHFGSSRNSMGRVKEMPIEELQSLLKGSDLHGEFAITEKVAKSIKNRIGKSITWP